MIDQYISKYINELNTLLSLLLTENQALISRNSEQVMDVLEKKKELLNTIEDMNRTLKSMPKASIKEFFSLNAHIEQQFIDLFNQCQQQNIQNGCYVTRSLHALQQFLATINPQLHNPLSQYNPQGKLF